MPIQIWIARIIKGNYRIFLTCRHWWARWFWDFLVYHQLASLNSTDVHFDQRGITNYFVGLLATANKFWWCFRVDVLQLFIDFSVFLGHKGNILVHFEPFCSIRHSTKLNAPKEGAIDYITINLFHLMISQARYIKFSESIICKFQNSIYQINYMN